MSRHKTTVEQCLYSCEGTSAELPILERGFTGVLATKFDFATPDGHDVEPRCLHSVDPALGNRLTKRLHSNISTTSTTNCCVTQLCRFRLGYAVQCIIQFVVGVGSNGICTAWVVVVENRFSPKLLDELKVRWRGCGDWAETGAIKYLISENHPPVMFFSKRDSRNSVITSE